MGSKSSITINQTLHGYRNGHQLLASSCELTMPAKRLMLFQSDLSGSLNINTFDAYLTGYPIHDAGMYAFAKSWYAYEMQRPGCVWTQTILIDFSDLGRFIDFSLLLSIFRRPDKSFPITDEYYNSIEIDLKVQPSTLKNDDIIKKKFIAQNLYFNPKMPLYIPADNPKEWEHIIISIWSDQWPRLRRNFTFCTGALDIKKLDNVQFDLQVMPYSTLFQIQNLAKGFEHNLDKSNILSSILKVSPDSKLRRFLWLVGSDIPGTRENYIALLHIYHVYTNNNLSLKELLDLTCKYFPEPYQAKTLKKRLFGEVSILADKTDEFSLLSTIILSNNFESINFTDLEINKRLLHLIAEKKLLLADFISLWNASPKGRLDINLWEQAPFTFDESLIDLFENNIDVLNFVLERSPKIVEFDWLWNCNIYCQGIIVERTFNDNSINWNKVLNHLLKNHNSVILDLYNKKGNEIIDYTLDWLNNVNDNEFFIYEWQNVIRNNINITKRWLYSNRKKLNINVYLLLYNIFSHQQLMAFSFPIDFWRRAARIATKYDNQQIASSALSVGFTRKLDGGEWIITEVFQYIFDIALQGKLTKQYWHVIPKEEYVEDDSNWFKDIFLFFSFRKSIKNVSDWDYCEILIRSLVNLYLKYPLNKQAFTQTLSKDYSFYRALEYCLSLRKGQKFLYQLDQQSKNSTFQILDFQRHMLDSINNIRL